MDNSKANTQIADGIYWVGIADDNTYGLQCNPYILIDGGEAVLFDPGSVLDFEYVVENIKKIISLKKIKYIVIHHQDPDLCSSIPLFEKENTDFTIVTHWRTQVLTKYYGIKSDYYLVDEHNYLLELKSGRKILFVPTPYLHFPGSIASYDKQTKVLFSGDLFGSMSESWSLYADDNYMEGMKAFHEHYMPSNDILRPVMETFLLMDISLIASQHGSIINKDLKSYINALKELECGTFLNTIKKNIKDAGGYAGICSIILRRLAAIYTKDELDIALNGLDIKLSSNSREILDYNYSGLELWESLFETIFKNQGIKWLLMVEPLIIKISKEYDMPMPRIMNLQLAKAKQETLLLRQEMIELKEKNNRLNQNIAQTQENIFTCPITGLYNETFFKEYLKTALDAKDYKVTLDEISLIIISIDDVQRFQVVYGYHELNNILKSVTYILKEISQTNHLLCRLDGANFAYVAPNISKSESLEIADKIRNEVKSSKMFIEEITVSIGVINSSELKDTKRTKKSNSQRLLDGAQIRHRIAKGRGGDLVVGDTDIRNMEYNSGKILIVDSDIANTSILKAYMNNSGYNTIIAQDGEEAISIAESELPDLIVSEVMLPKLDGFVVCEKLSYSSSTKSIPFILMSNLKNEDSVKRAISLGISHYLKKPYMMVELLGIIDLKLRK